MGYYFIYLLRYCSDNIIFFFLQYPYRCARIHTRTQNTHIHMASITSSETTMKEVVETEEDKKYNHKNIGSNNMMDQINRVA